MTTYRIAGACLNQTPLDWKNNLDNILNSISEARKNKVEILCLPELAICGYGCEDLFLSDWLPEKVLTYLPQIVDAAENIMVAIGLPIKFENNLYNCVCFIKDKAILGINAKEHLAIDGVHYEPRWFTSWKPGLIKSIQLDGNDIQIGDLIYEIGNLKIGFEICEDAWRGDKRPACRLMDKKVNLILNPSASHFAMGKSRRREELIVQSSGKFNCIYIYANLLGNESGRMIYDGEIFITQFGKLIQRNELLSYKPFNLVWADLDPHSLENARVEKVDESYQKEIEFVKSASLGLFDYLRKSHSNGFVLSLSGGADSSTCAVLVSEMVRRGITELGLENFLRKIHQFDDFYNIIKRKPQNEVYKLVVNKILTCAYQGTQNSSDDTFESAKVLAEEIGAEFLHWRIDEEVASYTKKIEKATGKSLTWEADDITLQNIQARSRSPIIWMIANMNKALLITTSNRSEGDVGYATMDGDTSGSISPIAAVDKHFINTWLEWAELHLNYPGLSLVNALNPSAELRPLDRHQTDESDLMPYDLLVEIEILAIREHLAPNDVFKILDKRQLVSSLALKKYIVKFYRLWARNQWKRERIAPSFHLDDFNIDPRTWCRFPILSGGFDEELKCLEES